MGIFRIVSDGLGGVWDRLDDERYFYHQERMEKARNPPVHIEKIIVVNRATGEQQEFDKESFEIIDVRAKEKKLPEGWKEYGDENNIRLMEDD